MRRSNGWGSEQTHYPVPASALPALAAWVEVYNLLAKTAIEAAYGDQE